LFNITSPRWQTKVNCSPNTIWIFSYSSSIIILSCEYSSLSNKSFIEPTPAEEAAARAKEEQEQAALPYKWAQTIGDLDITLEVPGNLKGRDLNVDIKKRKLVVGIKGQEPIITVHHLSHATTTIILIIKYPKFSSTLLTFLV
jgi:hypothetical protein